MGKLRQRGKIWWIRYYRNGKRYEESSGSDKQKKATALLRIREGDIEKGIAVTPQRLCSMPHYRPSLTTTRLTASDR